MRRARGCLGTITFIVVCTAIAGYVYAHCQIPCGIYNDDARLDMIAEDITTIEKSMKEITSLSKQQNKNYNQIVRWIQNKEVHADKIADIVTYYFMAQRITPADESDKKGHDSYVENLTFLHRLLVGSMKARQSTDLKHVEEMRNLLEMFRKTYGGLSGEH